ncbi:MAG: aminoglycoside phosphotransferase family protein [Leptospiraceae bacterium]|nr:aminoglycoside phosphotransferase family protein [Leptospiraceae bacterium]
MNQMMNFFEDDFDMLALQEEASTRRYFKAKIKNASSDKYENIFKEAFVVCKDTKINFEFIELSEYLIQNNIPVPKIYGFDKHLSYIYQEYLGSLDIYSCSEESYLPYVYKSIDLLIQLQSLNPPKIVSERFFDFEKLNFEVQLTLSSLQKMQLNLDIEFFIPGEFEIFLEETCKHLEKQEPRVFTHRDFHSRNIMIHDNKLYLIDFQDARMGLPVYDLSSILYDAYKPLSLSERKSLLEYYREKAHMPKKGFYDTYYLQALQRSFKALGTYIIQINEKQNMKFLPSFYACLDNLEEISQLGQLPDSVYLFVVDLRNKIQNVQKFQLTS